MSDTPVGARSADVRRMTFDDNALLAVPYGNHDRHLVRIEQLANVQLSARGNQLAIAGPPDDTAVAHKVIAGLYERLKRGLSIEMSDIDAAVRFAGAMEHENRVGILLKAAGFAEVAQARLVVLAVFR